MYTPDDFEALATEIAGDHSAVQIDFYQGEYVCVNDLVIYDAGDKLDYASRDYIDMMGYEPILTLSEHADLAAGSNDDWSTRESFAVSLAYFAYEAYLNR